MLFLCYHDAVSLTLNERADWIYIARNESIVTAPEMWNYGAKNWATRIEMMKSKYGDHEIPIWVLEEKKYGRGSIFHTDFQG